MVAGEAGSVGEAIGALVFISAFKRRGFEQVRGSGVVLGVGRILDDQKRRQELRVKGEVVMEFSGQQTLIGVPPAAGLILNFVDYHERRVGDVLERHFDSSWRLNIWSYLANLRAKSSFVPNKGREKNRVIV